MSRLSSRTPQMIDALVAYAVAQSADGQPLAGVEILDGPDISENAGRWLAIGVQDFVPGGRAMAADVRSGWAVLGARSRDQEGDILCAAFSSRPERGRAAQKVVRDEVYAWMDLVMQLCITTPTLGIDGVLSAGVGSPGGGGVEQLVQAPDGTGVRAYLLFSIHFEARI